VLLKEHPKNLKLATSSLQEELKNKVKVTACSDFFRTRDHPLNMDGFLLSTPYPPEGGILKTPKFSNSAFSKVTFAFECKISPGGACIIPCDFYVTIISARWAFLSKTTFSSI